MVNDVNSECPQAKAQIVLPWKMPPLFLGLLLRAWQSLGSVGGKVNSCQTSTDSACCLGIHTLRAVLGHRRKAILSGLVKP